MTPMEIMIINGPNLNLLGKRETAIYGDRSFDLYLDELRSLYPKHSLHHYQSNIEGELIDQIQQAGFRMQGIIINPAGYSHTSVSLADAIAAIPVPVVEVHISHVLAREDYRQVFLTASRCRGMISGFGLDGYRLAMEALLGSIQKAPGKNLP